VIENETLDYQEKITEPLSPLICLRDRLEGFFFECLQIQVGGLYSERDNFTSKYTVDKSTATAELDSRNQSTGDGLWVQFNAHSGTGFGQGCYRWPQPP
jgi:hypothetical protein